MDEDLQPAAGPAGTLRWLIWVTFVAGWTASLLTPHPVRLAHEVLPEEVQFVSFKSAHVVCYAVMAVLSGWLHVAPPRRWLLLVFLSAHAGLTELLQLYVPGRTASWADVGIDHVGILIGLALTQRWWRAPPVNAAARND